MRCSSCGKCCERTEMLLCEADIKKLEKAGYNRKSFVHVDKKGFNHLKNAERYCFFYGQTKDRCRAYKHRPLGCRIYPVMYSAEDGIIADDFCPMQATVTRSELKQKSKVLMRLLQTIDHEAKATLLLHKTDKQS